jgi:hypothetical protein
VTNPTFFTNLSMNSFKHWLIIMVTKDTAIDAHYKL